MNTDRLQPGMKPDRLHDITNVLLNGVALTRLIVPPSILDRYVRLLPV